MQNRTSTEVHLPVYTDSQLKHSEDKIQEPVSSVLLTITMYLIILIWGLSQYTSCFKVMLRSKVWPQDDNLCLKIIFLCKQTLNESFNRDTVLIPVSPDAPSQDFTANNAVTNHFSLMPHMCLAPLAQPSIQLNLWHVYFCSDTHPDAFQLQSHLKTITEKKKSFLFPSKLN